LPSSIYNLVELVDLYIYDTQIGGTLSEQIGNFTKLKNFYGYRNKWSGSLPAALGNITTLQNLYLYSNSFTGEIPENWRHLTSIKNLWVHYNQLSGEVPSWLGELTQLEILSIGDTNLHGAIPVSLGNLTKMTGLYLQNMDIAGTIPNELEALTKLTIVDLKFTNLSGPIPAWLMNRPTLKEFRLNNSKFTSLPDFSARTDKASLIINVENNFIPTADIERYFTGANAHPFSTFTYGPQQVSDIDTVIHAPLNDALRIEAPSGGTHGVYLWERLVNDVWTNISSQNQSAVPNVFQIQNVTPAWNGIYRYTVTNTWLSGIHIESGSLEVIITDPLTTGIKPLYNGMITSVRWRTAAAYGVEEGPLEGMYAFTYDDQYQIENASWAENINYTTGEFEWAGNKFRLAGMKYDRNGNILALNRYDKDASRTHNFKYTYLGNRNKLTSVSGYVNTYTYNAIGQMIGEDKVTGDDQYVVYDVTGKVTAVYSDVSKTVKKVEFLYDDRGFRLAKVNLQANRTTWYIRDASGNVISIYEQEGVPGENNTNPLVEVEVPIYGSGKLGTYYPNQDGSTAYEITDHLGNVRALVRENVIEYTATMEDNGQAEITNPRVQEMNYFRNIFETEVDDVHMNHTPADATIVSAPSNSAYLFWQSGMTGMEAADKAIGPAIALSVAPGDTIKVETYVRYENKTSYNRTGFTMSILSALLGNSFVSVKGFEGSTLAQTTQKFSDALMGGGFLGDTGDDTRPYAYLNYIVFDQSMTRITSDWVRVSEDGGFDPGEEGLPGMHAQVALNEPLVIPANGKYIYLWVSNESENTKVWFDDIKVTHVTTFVAQATDYGVWGDVLREQKTDETVYRYAYQGQFSERDLETGWSHFELREYDPVIGRWMATDPCDQYYSSYLGMSNNPISSVDPDGGYSWPGALWRQAAAWVTGQDPGEIYKSDGEWGFAADAGDGYEHFFGDQRRWRLSDGDQAIFNKVAENAWLSSMTRAEKGAYHLEWLAAHEGIEMVNVEFQAALIVTTWGIGNAASQAANGGGRMFWAGGEQAMTAATNYAKTTGGTTIGMTRAGQNLERLIQSRNIPWGGAGGAREMWARLSAVYARGATGPVHFFPGSTISPTSIWLTVEQPILLQRGITIISH
jgi:RHS repeat-associated protein